MAPLAQFNLSPIVHGSVARGDVKPSSDIDIFIPRPIPVYILTLALERAGFTVVKYVLVQATPSMAPKLYAILDHEEKRVVSFPLVNLSKTEYEFYYFGGALTYNELRRGLRVPGVDKRLVLIEPLPEGHRELSILGREGLVARIIKISVDTVMERERILSRREQYGKTGVFLKVEIPPTEGSVEEAINRLQKKNKWFRRVLLERGSPYI